MPQIEAKPYAFPYDGDLDPAKTALILIDMQVDFYHIRCAGIGAFAY